MLSENPRLYPFLSKLYKFIYKLFKLNALGNTVFLFLNQFFKNLSKFL